MADHNGNSAGRDEIVAYGGPYLSAMADVNRALFQQAFAVNREWSGYLHRCMNESVTTSKALMSANSPSNVIEICSEYVKGVTEGYQSQLDSLAQKNKALADEVASAINSGFRETGGARRQQSSER